MLDKNDVDDQLIDILMEDMENKCMTSKEKIDYLKNLIEYLNIRIKSYKEMGVNAGVGMFLIGAGIGTEINSDYNIYILITLCSLGVTSMLAPAIKRKQKNSNEQVINIDEIENKLLKKK